MEMEVESSTPEQEPEKKVVYIIGPMGAGKDTAVDYLKEKYGFSVFGLSKLVKDTAIQKGLELKRDNLNKVYDELKSEHGDEVVAKAAYERIKEENPVKILLNGGRNPAEILFIQKMYPNAIILYINSDLATRKERVIERKRDIDVSVNDQLDEILSRDLQDAQSCKDIPGVILVENNGNLEEFYQKLDIFVK